MPYTNPESPAANLLQTPPSPEDTQLIRNYGFTPFTTADVPELAGFDRRQFKQHALSEEEFYELFNGGNIVMGQRNDEGAIMCEGVLLLGADPRASTILERELPSWLAYGGGSAVHPSYQNQGVQRRLLRVREAIATAHGKQGIAAAVRQLNLKSLRNMLAEGYFVIADAPHFYGPSTQHDRIIAVKLFDLPNMFARTRLPAHMPLRNHTFLDAIAAGEPIIALEAHHDDTPDERYNAATAQLLRSGYAGIACQDIPGAATGPTQPCAMLYAKIHAQSPLAFVQTQLQALCNYTVA